MLKPFGINKVSRAALRVAVLAALASALALPLPSCAGLSESNQRQGAVSPDGRFVLRVPVELGVYARVPVWKVAIADKAGQLLYKGEHFLRVRLPDDLQECRFCGNVGQPTKVPHLVWHVVQREGFSNRGPRSPELSRHILVCIAAPLGELLKGICFLERRQVFPLQVLDERQLHDFRVVRFTDDDRDLAKPDLDCRVIAPLAGDDLIPPGPGPDDERFDDSLLGDRGHEL